MEILIYYPKLTSNSQKAITLSKNKQLGEYKNKLVYYSIYEAFYLIENKKAKIIKNNNKLTTDQAEKTLLKNKELYKKYLVFKELRKKGYIVKTGLKFGGDFRVYIPPKNQKDPLIPSHATWITYIAEKNISLDEFVSKNRIAHSTAKKLMIAIIDPEEKILFYEINWLRV
jgi:tRNA-intron endonuclease, archaea type